MDARISDDERRHRIAQLKAKIADKLYEIADLYTDDVKCTLIVRVPSKPDGSRDTVLTDDDPEKAIAALRSLFADPNSERYAR